MKKTVTTILSLALAVIMVSSLGSSVILAADHNDHKKKGYKTVKITDLVFVDCGNDPSGTMTNLVTGFESSTDENIPTIMVGVDFCIDANAAMLNTEPKFKLHDFGAGFDPDFRTLVSRSIFVRTRKVRVEKE